MAGRAVVGVDIGTSSSKGVLVASNGTILRTATREHSVARPRPGHVESSGSDWWREFKEIVGELLAPGDAEIYAVGVSGMGPCLLLADADNHAVRPAILYGVDTRAGAQIRAMNDRFGEIEIMQRGGSLLSSQAVGPKIAWVREHEPDAYARSRRFFMPSSWLVSHLTGAYILDYHSASQCTPLFDSQSAGWNREWTDIIAPGLELPELLWPGDVAGRVTTDAAAETGLPEGIPVIAGTIDAWSESVSVGAVEAGDLMLMYGTTMFLVNTVEEPVTSRAMWGTVGVRPGTHNLAGGMATSGAITGWLRELVGSPSYPELLAEADAAGTGANGLLMLPYFAGERTPIADPDARGLIAGLTISTTRGDLYRAALEATAFGVRHNVEAMIDAGAPVRRVLAVGGGAQGQLWTQIVSDVTGLSQVIPSTTVGASFGAALLAARTQQPTLIDDWNPPAALRSPNPAVAAEYDELYSWYRALHPATAELSHFLAGRQHAAARA